MSLFSQHIQLSKLVKFALLFYLLGIFANVTYRHFNGFETRNFVMSSDMEGYYQYLPYVLLKDKEEIKNMRWAKPYEEGKKLNVFTCGVAILQLPFFVAAHGITKYLDLEPSGYGPVYFSSVFFATLFYVMLGLIFLYKALLRFFKPKMAFLSVVLIFYATNLFYYTVMSPGMSHGYSFFLISVYIYFVPVFYAKTGVKSTLLVAFPLALATLIRPTTIVVLLYFLLYGVATFTDLKERITFFVRKWHFLLIMLLTGILVFSPQMMYWHFVTGKFFLYSYQEEGFTNILSPKIFTVLFGPRNGWFIYTPLMLFATAGLIYLTCKRKLNSIATLIILIIIVYLNSSWWRPTFSSAAGYRALVEFLPLMAIPLTYFSEKVLNHKNNVLKIGYKSVLVLFVVYNILFSYQYSPWHWWNTDWTWSYFLKLVQF